jgi:hypothetical protein
MSEKSYGWLVDNNFQLLSLLFSVPLEKQQKFFVSSFLACYNNNSIFFKVLQLHSLVPKCKMPQTL